MSFIRRRPCSAVATALFFSAVILVVGGQQVAASEFSSIDQAIGTEDAVLVSDNDGRVLFSKHAGKKLVPASTLKILTSLAALNLLGPDYRFPTEFYLDKDDNLRVKGFGDPLLISEALDEIASKLRGKITHYKDLVLDISFFEHPLSVPGVSPSFEPYDAPNGALCVNFNTVGFKQTKDGHLVSAEPQTPLLPFVIKRIKSSGLRQGRIILSAEKNEFIRYAGHLLAYFLKKRGIISEGSIRIKSNFTGNDAPILTYHSGFSLKNIVARLMISSNNFMANQLFLALGAHVYDPPGSLQKGIRAVSTYASGRLGFGAIQIVEGSGISRANRLSAEELDRMLEAFEPYYKFLRCKDRMYYKTGTLNGIRTQAGYIVSKNGKMYRFVILLNTPEKTIQPIVDGIQRVIEKKERRSSLE